MGIYTEWTSTGWWEKFQNLFNRFETVHECDGRTDTTRRHRPRYAYSVARQQCIAGYHGVG